MKQCLIRTVNTSFCRLLLLSFFIGPLQAENLHIRVDQGGYPATYKVEGMWLGMDIELLEQILERSELDHQFVEMPFQRSLLEMREGNVHIIPNLVKNAERSNYMHWIGPTRITCIGLVVQKKDADTPITSTDQLINFATVAGKKVGYLSGASYSAYFDQRLQKDSKLQETLLMLPSNNQHREMLMRGRIYGYFYDAFEIQSRLSDARFSSLYEGLALNAFRVEDSCIGAYIGVSHSLDKKRVSKLLSAFDSMRRDGSFNSVHEKWLNEMPGF